MSFLDLPDPRAKAFTERWAGSSSRLPSDLYWDPRAGAWVSYRSPDHTISDVGIPSPDVAFKTPDEVFERVEKSWAEIKAQHPKAVFDPRAAAWRIVTSAKTTPAPPKDDLAKRMERAKVELDALDQQYRAGILNAEEWERRRQEVRRKYQLE
jgi:hypothetical protein